MTVAHDKPADPSETGRIEKRTYIKPAFRHEAVFEVMALACGKVDTTQASCTFAVKTS